MIINLTIRIVFALTAVALWLNVSMASEANHDEPSTWVQAAQSPLIPLKTSQHTQTQNAIIIGSINKRSTWYTDHNEFRGIEYFLATQFSQFANRPIELIAYPSLGELRDALQRGDIDVVAAGVNDQWIDTTSFVAGPNYRTVLPVIVTPRSSSPGIDEGTHSGIPAPSEIVVIDNGYSEHIARQHFQTAVRVDPQANMPVLVESVSRGIIDAAVIDLHAFQHVSMLYPDLQAHSIGGVTPNHTWLTSHRDPTLSAMIQQFFRDHLDYIALDNMMAAELPRITEFSEADARSFRFLMRARLPAFSQTIVAAAETVNLPTSLIAAVGFQESHWSANATSPTGVKGFMMLTQTTAAELGVVDRTNASASIFGGARYLRKLYNNLPDRLSYDNRIAFALASYNMGRSHLEDARILAQQNGYDPDRWDHVKPFVIMLEDPNIYASTKRGYARGRECATYVDNVLRYQALLDTTPYLVANSIQRHTRYAVAP
ncbi:transglycosylase SLT domain-containing protein [Umboniibacter marinipuniceus]|uniref:Membrane-bound lytic murein transglycosylase F n=1 Tax=Umboniibacter marinipuniceus TaxID=569599 RepID=A0A3M0ACR1_9GAMM|nr:transglycosylase SLT domain-containing protein [Umboniibacter marinipuniceus]RMA81419.1 membrane-bound lytic murein transglycosylase F [Umboniibacter marinipuniceus]